MKLRLNLVTQINLLVPLDSNWVPEAFIKEAVIKHLPLTVVRRYAYRVKNFDRTMKICIYDISIPGSYNAKVSWV